MKKASKEVYGKGVPTMKNSEPKVKANAPEASASEASIQIQHIPLDKLIPSKGNRQVGGFNDERLAQLADSIASIGVQQPAVVRLVGDVFEIVAGERRWRASKLAGVPTLPCIVKELDDTAALHIQLIENLQREDIHPLDEADGFSRLIEEGHYEIEYIAKELGRSAVYVYQRLRLRKLIPGARSKLAAGTLSVGHANLIARLPSKQQKEALEILNRPWALSIKDFDEQIRREILMELSRASWKLDDETLLPSAGSCAACPKRTGAEPQLFAELGKKDCCTDRTCFEAKEKALIEKRQAELEGIEHLEVRDGYSGDTNANALAPHEWVECKKKDEGAVRVLVVGGDHPGRLTYGKLRSHVKVPAEKKEERKHEKKVEKARNEYALKLYEGLLGSFNGDDGITPELLRRSLLQFWRSLGHDTKCLIAKLEGWEKPDYQDTFLKNHFETLQRCDLERFLLVFAFAGFSKISAYSSGADRTLIEAAMVAGIYPEKLLEEIVKKYGLAAEDVQRQADDPDDLDDDDFEDEDTEAGAPEGDEEGAEA
jgi:ParB/RepB/Spo0J family partition protein